MQIVRIQVKNFGQPIKIIKVGSYECTCKEFFTGNGYVCDDIDECQTGTARGKFQSYLLFRVQSNWASV